MLLRFRFSRSPVRSPSFVRPYPADCFCFIRSIAFFTREQEHPDEDLSARHFVAQETVVSALQEDFNHLIYNMICVLLEDPVSWNAFFVLLNRNDLTHFHSETAVQKSNTDNSRADQALLWLGHDHSESTADPMRSIRLLLVSLRTERGADATNSGWDFGQSSDACLDDSVARKSQTVDSSVWHSAFVASETVARVHPKRNLQCLQRKDFTTKLIRMLTNADCCWRCQIDNLLQLAEETNQQQTDDSSDECSIRQIDLDLFRTMPNNQMFSHNSQGVSGRIDDRRPCDFKVTKQCAAFCSASKPAQVSTWFRFLDK